jgi:mRNA-degrading endonuclease toxin of MazEF toxin-antitoxin module
MTGRGSLVQTLRSLVRSGDVLRVDFGIPIGSTPALVRPAIVVTADQTLASYTTTFHVVPVTTNVQRSWSSDVRLDESLFPLPSAAQCHLCTLIDASQVLSETGTNVGPVQLTQIRSIVADLLDLS